MNRLMEEMVLLQAVDMRIGEFLLADCSFLCLDCLWLVHMVNVNLSDLPVPQGQRPPS